MIDSAKDLGKAIKNGEEYIEIEGDLKDRVIKIKATGMVAWAVAIGAVGVAITSVYLKVGSGGTAAPATTAAFFTSAVPATSILGVKTAVSAVAIGVAAGGVRYLNKLRSYKLINKGNYIVLRKK